jgi:pSer/pThr/pTyr-binding forkhead associated (FHA) protein
MERLVLSWVGKPLAFDLMPGLNRLGRNPTNDFRVGDASISGFHCELTLAPDKKLYVRDLASTNGTYIDGVQTDDGELRPGQTLRLGSVEMQLESVNVAEPALVGGGSDSAEMWKSEEKSEKPLTFIGKLTQTLRITRSR